MLVEVTDPRATRGTRLRSVLRGEPKEIALTNEMKPCGLLLPRLMLIHLVRQKKTVSSRCAAFDI